MLVSLSALPIDIAGAATTSASESPDTSWHEIERGNGLIRLGFANLKDLRVALKARNILRHEDGKTSGGDVRKLPQRRGRHVPLLPFSSAYPVPELNEQNPRAVFLLTAVTEETINSAFHLALHGPRKYSNFKLQGDEHSNHESVTPTVMEFDSRTKVKKASLILSGSMPGWPSEGLSLIFSLVFKAVLPDATAGPCFFLPFYWRQHALCHQLALHGVG